MPSVEGLHVTTIELAHALGEVRLWGFDDQGIMVAHQTVRVAEEVKVVNNLPQTLQEGVTIPVVIENIFPGIAPGRHTVDRSIKLQPQRVRHDQCLLHS